jgi:hypothetical protein
MWIIRGAGAYRYPAGGEWIKGMYSTGALLGGNGFEGNNYEINLLAGASAETDTLSTYGPQQRHQRNCVWSEGARRHVGHPTQK